MTKSTKKRALESTEKKNEDTSAVAAIQFNDWCDVSDTKRIRNTTTSAGRQLLELRKFDGEDLPTESGIVFNEEEIKNLIHSAPAIDSNYESALFIGEDIDFKKILAEINSSPLIQIIYAWIFVTFPN